VNSLLGIYTDRVDYLKTSEPAAEVGGDGALGGRAVFAEGGGTAAPEADPFRYGAVGRKTKDSGRVEIGGLMAGSGAGRLYVWTV